MQSHNDRSRQCVRHQELRSQLLHSLIGPYPRLPFVAESTVLQTEALRALHGLAKSYTSALASRWEAIAQAVAHNMRAEATVQSPSMWLFTVLLHAGVLYHCVSHDLPICLYCTLKPHITSTLTNQVYYMGVSNLKVGSATKAY